MNRKTQYVLAAAGDEDQLTQIAMESKRHWNYPEEWMQLWTESLTITPGYITENKVVKIISDDNLVGFYSLEYNEKQLFIGHFWILPRFIGNGYGREAFADIRERCLAMNEHIVEVESDPYAEGFYKTLGASKVGSVATLIEGRELSVLQFRF
ncbi:MAG TPA: GNAT family N-acetyltransferase [Chitinophaga sp.]|uniref:GNAT family N-acetyltransferase n=1 Tax=Chitinophaga sp. TaxID=1869181 RepID=UPI002BA205CF|nr:GNAT family N-acetyltransferase [Chitinophaga sp.]HVI44109.1 GNAT family N-acetyltransferase [Chitinophaga sp.]